MLRMTVERRWRYGILLTGVLNLLTIGNWIPAKQCRAQEAATNQTAGSSVNARSYPRWIWGKLPESLQERQNVTTPDQFSLSGPLFAFSRRHHIESGLREAHLRFAGDFCRSRIELNGQIVTTVDPYSPTLTLDVTNWVKAGENELLILANSVVGPSALALELTLVGRDGMTTRIVTDERWAVSLVEASDNTAAKTAIPTLDHGPVRPELWGIGTRPITVSAAENYEQWQQAKSIEGTAVGPRFWTVPGFDIHQVHAALPDQGSWVSLTFDPTGRIILAREDKGFLRLTLDSSRMSVAKTEVINSELLECRGLVYLKDSLYINANNSKAMYRMRDENGDGQFETLQKLRDFPGGVGHGRNDLAISPDGGIYSIHGDSVQAPTSQILDLTSPLRDSRRGPPFQEGHLIRTDADGKNWSLVCTGLRNPFGIAFNPVGDLFTYDADNEYDMGSPWYRPTRILQLVSGADYGWRVAQGRWPPYFPDRPDNGQPLLDIGRGSPTSLMFGTDCRFPTMYRKCLFALDWTYGRVLAIHLAPRGAGYRSEAELFLQGKPLNVTDLATGPDGAMYLITGGRKTQSALYRVSYQGRIDEQVPVSDHELKAEAFAKAQRAVRTRLESFHGRVDPQAVSVAWQHLDSPDPMIRHAARIAIEQQPIAEWKEKALIEAVGFRALPIWISLVKTGDRSICERLIKTMLAMDPSSAGPYGTLTLLNLYQQIAFLKPEVYSANQTRIASQLLGAWPSMKPHGLWVSPDGSSDEVRRRIAVVLGELNIPQVIGPSVTTLISSPVQEDQLAGLLALRNLKTGWSLEQRKAYFTTLNGSTAYLTGEGMPTFLTRLRTDATASLSTSERQMLGDLIVAPKSPVDDIEPTKPRPVVKKWTLDDLKSLTSNEAIGGNRIRGEAIFREAQCIRCHRVGARGPAVGPDLTFLSRRFSRRDMCESILTPSRTVAENYRNTQVITKSGQVLIGRVISDGDYRSEKLKLNSDPLNPSQLEVIDKKDIEEFRLVESSPMPEGLLDGFTIEEIKDLLAFLDGTGNKSK